MSYNIQLAERTEALIRRSKNWEVISPATLAVINFRYNPRTSLQDVKDTLNLCASFAEK